MCVLPSRAMLGFKTLPMAVFWGIKESGTPQQGGTREVRLQEAALRNALGTVSKGPQATRHFDFTSEEGARGCLREREKERACHCSGLGQLLTGLHDHSPPPGD